MFRFLFRVVVLIVLLGAVGVFLLGWGPAAGWLKGGPPAGPSEPAGTGSAARGVGAEISAKAAEAATQAQAALSDGSLTAKIKAKMALDDTIQAGDIRVALEDGVVTLTGTVGSAAERQRAIDLARETKGVTSVVDRLVASRR